MNLLIKLFLLMIIVSILLIPVTYWDVSWGRKNTSKQEQKKLSGAGEITGTLVIALNS